MDIAPPAHYFATFPPPRPLLPDSLTQGTLESRVAILRSTFTETLSQTLSQTLSDAEPSQLLPGHLLMNPYGPSGNGGAPPIPEAPNGGPEPAGHAGYL